MPSNRSRLNVCTNSGFYWLRGGLPFTRLIDGLINNIGNDTTHL